MHGNPSNFALWGHGNESRQNGPFGLLPHLHWQSAPAGRLAKAKKASKTKFTCPDCGQNAWAKPDALLGCYACYEETEELVLMLAEPSDEDEAPSHNLVPEKPQEW
jgi:hypothetical protein